MDLDTFIVETLRQIVKGVKEAQQHDDCKGALINPVNARGGGATTQVAINPIDFDVALTVSQENAKEGKASIGLACLGIGGQGKATTASSCVSRVKFSVPTILPPYPVPDELPVIRRQ